MFIVLYRWRLRPGFESQFQEAWSEVTLYYRDNFGSSGSRLHRGSDGLFYAYAIWASADDREQAFVTGEAETEHHRERMNDAIEERYPEVVLKPIADHII